METLLKLSACAVVLTLAASCTEEPETPKQATESTLERVENKFEEAQEEAEEVTDALTEELRSRIDKLDAMIKDLKEEAGKVEPETRTILETSAADLQVKRTALADKLVEIERASDAAWEEFRIELDQALLDFKAVYDSVLQKTQQP